MFFLAVFLYKIFFAIPIFIVKHLLFGIVRIHKLLFGNTQETANTIPVCESKKTIVLNKGKERKSRYRRRRCRDSDSRCYCHNSREHVHVKTTLSSNLHEMEALNKKQRRREKKKKKLLALANLLQLNDENGIEKVTVNTENNIEREMFPTQTSLNSNTTAVDATDCAVKSENQPTTCNDNDDDGFTKVKYNRKSRKHHHEHDIECKRFKDEPKPETKLNNFHTNENYDNNNSINGTNNNNNNNNTDNDNEKINANDDIQDYKVLKKQLNQRKLKIKIIPDLFLQNIGVHASLKTGQDDRIPIFLTDIQHLLMDVLLEKKSPFKPERWCQLVNKSAITQTIVLIVNGMSLYHYYEHEESFTNSQNIFDEKLEIVLPNGEENGILKELAKVPLSVLQTQQLIDEYGSLEIAMEMIKDPILLVRCIFPIEKSKEPVNLDLHAEDKFPRTKLLLSALQMVHEGYPMPLRGHLFTKFKDYKFTKDNYIPVTNKSPMFGIDCEMCRTAIGANELTRISVVNENLESIYETLVLPDHHIVDYLTRFSGITKEMMATASKTLKDVQHEISELLPADAILVGQSLNADLNAMRMMHPYVIDTSVIFNLTGRRNRKSKLKVLSETFLKELIQENLTGHDSIEDSKATLKLVKLKLANNIAFGDEILRRQTRYEEIVREANSYSKNILDSKRTTKSIAIVTEEGLLLPELKSLQEKEIENENAKIYLGELENSHDIIKQARTLSTNYSLTMINIKIKEENLCPQLAPNTVTQIDKWISKLWSNLSHNSMFVVLMGGSADSTAGIAKIGLKKNIPQ